MIIRQDTWGNSLCTFIMGHVEIWKDINRRRRRSLSRRCRVENFIKFCLWFSLTFLTMMSWSYLIWNFLFLVLTFSLLFCVKCRRGHINIHEMIWYRMNRQWECCEKCFLLSTSTRVENVYDVGVVWCDWRSVELNFSMAI
jgi:hypothetical protein